MNKRRVASVIGALAISMPISVAITAPADAASTGKYYSSCAKLTKNFKHGVSKSKAAARKQVRQGYASPAYGKKARAVYARNKSRLDRDKDGTACER